MKYIVILFFLVGCYSQNNQYSYSVKDCTQQPVRVSVSDLINTPQRYKNIFVEVSGLYNWSIEESAISSSGGSKNKIWIEFNEEMVKDDSTRIRFLDPTEFEKVVGKRITIRGTVDLDNHGHLGGYPMAIINICYIKVLQ